MAFFDDFKRFAFKGNIIDLAVGVVVGGAFGRIVSAMVDNIVMPVVSLFMPSGNWREAGFILRAGSERRDDVVLQYGPFLGSLLDFLVVALVLFVLVKRLLMAAERALHVGPPPPPALRACPECLSEIPAAATRCKFCQITVPVAA